jgi:hypothetical protein
MNTCLYFIVFSFLSSERSDCSTYARSRDKPFRRFRNNKFNNITTITIVRTVETILRWQRDNDVHTIVLIITI